MRLTSTTALLKNTCKPFTNEVETLKKFGFEGIDFELNYRLSELLGKQWQEKVERVAQSSYENDIPIVQTHLPYFWTIHDIGAQIPDPEAVKEAVLATEIMGAEYGVFHACSPEKREDGFRLTYEHYMPLIEFADEHNVKMLIEIMPDTYNYPVTVEELCYAADKMNIGVCWDFGHPNVNKYGLPNSQADMLRYAGERIKALHVNDNSSARSDEHLPPYMGKIQWDTDLPVLREIGYSGDFNYEVLAKNMPEYTIPLVAEYLVKVGHHLMELCS